MEVEGDCDRGGKPWGFMAEGVTDAPACISNCQSSFLDKLAADNGSFDHICSYLSTDVRTENEDVDVAFWDLYCCDSQLCGVDHLDSKERDPNINWIIETCQSIGNYSLIDPGPPAPSYTCNVPRNKGNETACGMVMAQSASWESDKSSSSPATTLRTQVAVRTTAESTPMEMTPRQSPSAFDMGISLDAGRDGSSSSSPPPSGGMSTATKVTVALSVVAGVAAIALGIFCFVRHRKSRSGSEGGGQRWRRRGRGRRLAKRFSMSRTRSSQPTSPTPLVFRGPWQSPVSPLSPLSPPPPLRDRRMLPVSNISGPPSSVSLTMHPSTSTATTATAKKTRESSTSPSKKKKKKKTKSNIEPVPPWPWPLGPPASITGTAKNQSSPELTDRTASFQSLASIDDRVTRPWFWSPTDPIPSSPGPPPTRALPSTPSTTALATAALASATGTRAGVSTPPPPPAPTPAGSPENIGIALSPDTKYLPQESRELCELTVRYGSPVDSRHWSSWGPSDYVGGVGGPSASPKRSGEARVDSPIMGEKDLENLGGRY